MAERHSISIRVKDGVVADVQFCDCCPPVTVEVRTYTDDAAAASAAVPVWYLADGPVTPSEFTRDEAGVYRASYYESDTEAEAE